MPTPAPVLRDVVEEHLEELGYLCVQRRRMLFSPEVGPSGLRSIDARCAAHRDAVEVAGRAAVEVAEGRLDERDPWQHAAAARVWIEEGRPDPETLASRLRAAPEDALPSWREALRRAGPGAARGLARAGAHRGSARVLALVVDAAGWHREPPPEPLAGLAEHDAPEVRAAAARSRADGPIEDLLRDREPRVARAALWSLALADSESAAARCRASLDAGVADPFVVQTLGLLGTLDDVDRVLPWIAPPATRAAAIRALGNLGSAATIGLLLRLLDSGDLETALAAGDALETILGVLPEPPPSRAPRESDAGPLPLRASWAREQWRLREGAIDAGRRWHRGRPYPSAGDGAEAPMERLWRLGIVGSDPALAWAKREVWDGFFEAAPTHEARPGE